MSRGASAGISPGPLRAAIRRRWNRMWNPPRPAPIMPLSRILARSDQQILICPSDLAALRAIAPGPVAKLEATYLRIQRVLTGADLQYVELLIGSALTAAHLVPEGSGRKELIRTLLNGYATDIGVALATREQVSARAKYAKGLFAGVWLSIIVLGAIGYLAVQVIHLVSHRTPTPSELYGIRDALVAVGGGGAGAVVSVLIRLSSASYIDDEAVTAGAARNRIMLGWFFAAAVLFLVKGGIVTVINDPTAAVIGAGGAAAPLAVISSWFFWGGVGFLAGFNERWARSLISRNVSPTEPVPNRGTATLLTTSRPVTMSVQDEHEPEEPTGRAA